MVKRFVTIWFRQFENGLVRIRQPALRDIPFVLAAPDHGRMIITAANKFARIRRNRYQEWW